MSPLLDGHLLTVDLVVTVFGVPVKVTGTIEALAVRKKVER